ncbi:MAG: helix-hairpin-helix domain-containing protein [Candidatus Brocadiia bacterium]|nr:helix-hairpin-helix domain-containing protein [Candidatus Brocadiia bacterium]
MKGFSTRWLELSRSELRVLSIAAGVVLLFFIAVHLVRWAVWEPTLEVRSARETLRAPARLDLNAASEHELMLLPGIGEHMAREIARYREEHGNFETLEGLTKVRGIGPVRLERLRPYLMCAPPGREGDR